MKKYLLIQCVFLLFTAPLFAQNSSNNALLWEISGNGLKQPSYLFGTFHALCKGDLNDKITPKLEDKFGKCQQLCMEIDLNEKGMQWTMLQGAFMKDEKKLQDLISAEEYTLVKTFFKDTLHKNLDKFQRMKPMFLSSLPIENYLGCKIKSLEKTFNKMAKKQGMSTTGLETADFQMSVFDKIPYEEQAEGLVQMAKDFNASRKEFNALLKAYNERDMKNIEQLSQESEEIEGFTEELLLNRNANWIPKMQKMMGEKTTFFAVGAGHLPGEKGVIQLLKTQGYTVTPVE